MSKLAFGDARHKIRKQCSAERDGGIAPGVMGHACRNASGKSRTVSVAQSLACGLPDYEHMYVTTQIHVRSAAEEKGVHCTAIRIGYSTPRIDHEPMIAYSLKDQ
jgi:hypothetical protein